MYIVPHSAPAASAATIPFVADAPPACEEDAIASSVAPPNITAAPPTTESHRLPPAPRSSWKSNQPQKIPSKLFKFHRGNAMLRPMLRIAKIVRVFATAHRHPASTPHRIRCGAWRTSRLICAVPRTSAGTLHLARKTPPTISNETITGEIPMLTSFVGASAAPSHAPALNPHRSPTICNCRRRFLSNLPRALGNAPVAFNASNAAPTVRPVAPSPVSRDG